MLLPEDPQMERRLVSGVGLALHEHLEGFALRCFHNHTIIPAQVPGDVPLSAPLQLVGTVPLKVSAYADVAGNLVILLAQLELQPLDLDDDRWRIQRERRDQPRWTFRGLVLIGDAIPIRVCPVSGRRATIIFG
jgi:hypothetical protein